jgi:hypothetical protein
MFGSDMLDAAIGIQIPSYSALLEMACWNITKNLERTVAFSLTTAILTQLKTEMRLLPSVA